MSVDYLVKDPDPAAMEPPVFMVGMGRSGSTVIAEAISAHENLGWFSSYVTKFPFLPWLAFLDRIVRLPQLSPYLMGKKKQSQGFVASIRRYLPHLDEPYPILERYCGKKISVDYLINHTASENEKDRIRGLVRKILKLQGRKRLFVKFTGPPRIHYLNSIFPDAYYLHMLRDPRAVVYSLVYVDLWIKSGGLEKPSWQHGLFEKDLNEWYETGRSPVALAAIQWKKIVELAWEEKEELSAEQYIEIRYEDFVRDPHVQLSAVFEKARLRDSAMAHDYIASRGKLSDMNYKYKKVLLAKDIALIEKITYQTAKRAGYVFE